MNDSDLMELVQVLTVRGGVFFEPVDERLGLGPLRLFNPVIGYVYGYSVREVLERAKMEYVKKAEK